MIANEHYRLRRRPGPRWRCQLAGRDRLGRELIADGRVGNELAVYDEYPAHPQAGEGPVAPAAQGAGRRLVRRARPTVQAYRSARWASGW